jgi:hypothetical protein
MKINSIKVNDNITYKVNEDKVNEIKYFESSQIYGKFLHEAIYVVEYENSTIKTIVPVRSVVSIDIDTKKEVAVMPVLENLGD